MKNLPRGFAVYVAVAVMLLAGLIVLLVMGPRWLTTVPQDPEAAAMSAADVRKNHPGGTTNETLTVYALVSALTSNLPAVSSVQILIEGKEVDTLAGHLDLRRPIEQDLKWVTN